MTQVLPPYLKSLETHKRLVLGALLVLATFAMAAIYIEVASGQGAHQLPAISDEERVMNADDGYPDVVATVNGDPISGKALSVQVAQLNMSATVPANPPATGLGQLIREQLLLQEAKSLDVWPTSEDIDAAIGRFVSSYNKLSADSEERQFIDNELALQSIDPARLASNDLYRAATEHNEAIGAVKDWVRQSLPESQRNDPAAVEKAEDDLVQGLWSQADIQRFVSIGPEVPGSPGPTIDK
jgi:hypothetical protein